VHPEAIPTSPRLTQTRAATAGEALDRMRNGAEPSFLPEPETLPHAPALRVLPTEHERVRAARDALVQRLAADRVRELRDDGVTMAYVARIYDVEIELLEQVLAELMPGRPR
jgi:hypothetical protein